MKKVFVSIAVVLGTVPVFAQNLNPKVQVVNDYDVSVADVTKSGTEMSVPDSLLNFGYKFDYNIYESAYKGAYDVPQYFVKTSPGAVPGKNNNFYLNAGAGYNLRPELNFNWQAARKGRYNLNIDNNFGGAYGNFSSVSRDGFTGYDFGENLKIANIWRLDKSVLKVNVGYDGIFNSLKFAGLSNMGYNSAFCEFKATSPENSIPNFYYDFGLKYRYADDRHDALGGLVENYFKIDGKLGPSIKDGKYKILLDFAFEGDLNGGCFSSNSMLVWLKPHVGFLVGPVDLDLGVNLAYASKFGDSSYSPRFKVLPDVTASVRMCDSHFRIFAGFRGEEKLLSYSSMKFKEHAYNYNFGMLGDTYTEWFNAYLGFSGYASNAFQYMLKAGYGMNEGAPRASYDYNSGLPCYSAVDYSKLFVTAMLGWNDERIESDLTFNFNKCWYAESTAWRKDCAVLDEPMFELKANFTYNWFKRIFAGVFCDWRSGTALVGPYKGNCRGNLPFVNLGVKVSYMFNDKFGIWLKGANLLNQELWYSDFYARKGIEGTVGITLTL